MDKSTLLFIVCSLGLSQAAISMETTSETLTSRPVKPPSSLNLEDYQNVLNRAYKQGIIEGEKKQLEK